MNNDTYPDIVSRLENDIKVNLGNGDGSFQADYTITNVYIADFGNYQNDDQSLQLADLNGDGSEDIIAKQGLPYYKIMIYLSNGDGTFDLDETIYYNNGSDSEAIYSIDIGDINDDNKADIVYSVFHYRDQTFLRSSIGVMLGFGDGSFGPRNEVVFR